MKRHTSSEAYAINLESGYIDGIRLEVYTALHRAPGSTAHEIANTSPLSNHQIDSVRPRFAELERAKLIVAGEARECRISKMKALTWALTSAICKRDSFKKPKI